MVRALLLVIPALCAAAPKHQYPILLDQAFRQLYSLQFESAHQTAEQFQRLYPDNPLGSTVDAAAYLYSELDRLHILRSEFFVDDQHFLTDREIAPDPAWKREFEASLATASKLCSAAPDSPDARLASILASGIRANYLALIQKKYIAAVMELKAARVKAERLLAADPTAYDAWLAIGVENYALSVKSAPVRWFLRLGGAGSNRAHGIEALKLTVEKGHYLAPLAEVILAVAALRDHDTSGVCDLLSSLSKRYPENPRFAAELAKLNPDGMR